MSDENIKRIADAVMVRLAPFFLGVLDGAEMDAPKAREALSWFIADGIKPAAPPRRD